MPILLGIFLLTSPDVEPHHQIFKTVLQSLPYQYWFFASDFSSSHPQWVAQTKYTWGLTLLSHSYYVARRKNTTMLCLCPGLPSGLWNIAPRSLHYPPSWHYSLLKCQKPVLKLLLSAGLPLFTSSSSLGFQRPQQSLHFTFGSASNILGLKWINTRDNDKA